MLRITFCAEVGGGLRQISKKYQFTGWCGTRVEREMLQRERKCARVVLLTARDHKAYRVNSMWQSVNRILDLSGTQVAADKIDPRACE